MLSLQQLGTAHGRDVFFRQQLRHYSFIATRTVTDCNVDPVSREIRQLAGGGESNIDVSMVAVEAMQAWHQPATSKSVGCADTEDARRPRCGGDERRSA